MKRESAHTLTTVIIRTLGRPTLQRAVDSAQAEGYRALVVVDGPFKPEVALPDGFGMVLLGRRWGFYGGMAANVGAALARTPFVTFLDDDDEFIPGTGPRFRADLAARRDIDIVIAGTVYDREITVVPDDGPRYRTRTLCVDPARGVVLGNVHMATFKVDLFARMPFVDDVPADKAAASDFHQIRRWVLAGHSIAWVGYPIYSMRPVAGGGNGRGRR